MRRLKSTLRIPLSFCISSFCLFASETSSAWGRLGHELVAEIGSELATETFFFKTNTQAMRVHTNTPDSVWKSGAWRNLEASTHWFEPDAYDTNSAQFPAFPRQYSEAKSRYGENRLNENGTAPWRILQTYDSAVEALKLQNWIEALQMAAVMSHYVGDLAQPLHVTVNYDGQLTGQRGIHSFFESTNLNRFERGDLKGQVKAQAQVLLSTPSFLKDFEGRIVDVAFNSVLRSYKDKAEILNIDQRLGRGEAASRAQIEIAVRRLADASATMALILDRMWNASGLKSAPAKSFSVPVPEFLRPEYYDEESQRERALSWQYQNGLASTEGVESSFVDDCLAP